MATQPAMLLFLLVHRFRCWIVTRSASEESSLTFPPPSAEPRHRRTKLRRAKTFV
jgi:hypothetical protein